MPSSSDFGRVDGGPRIVDVLFSMGNGFLDSLIRHSVACAFCAGVVLCLHLAFGFFIHPMLVLGMNPFEFGGRGGGGV
jgi:hypothetical protein